MGKSVTITGTVGLGSIIFGVGAPKMIEGLPDWVNTALFAVGAILIAAAFIAHLITDRDGDGGKAQASHGSGSPNIGTVGGDAIIAPTIVGFSAVNSSYTTLKDNIIQVGQLHGREGHQSRPVPPAIISAFSGPYGKTILVNVRLLSQDSEARDFADQVVDTLRSAGINAKDEGVFLGHARVNGIEVSGDPSPGTENTVKTLIKVFQISQLRVTLGHPVAAGTPLIRIVIGDNR